MTMERISREVQAGRDAVEAYREAHAEMHAKGWDEMTVAAHRPLLEKLEADLVKEGYETFESFYRASEDENARQLGYKDGADLLDKGSEADKSAVRELWR